MASEEERGCKCLVRSGFEGQLQTSKGAASMIYIMLAAPFEVFSQSPDLAKLNLKCHELFETICNRMYWFWHFDIELEIGKGCQDL